MLFALALFFRFGKRSGTMKHPLQKHLEKTGQSQNAFAKAAGVHVSHINKIIRGIQPPSVEVAKKLDRATKGAVPWTAYFPKS